MLLKGDIIPRDTIQAKEYLKDKLDDSNAMFLYVKILRHENNFQEAIKIIKKSCNEGNPKAMYEYAKMQYKGEGCIKNLEKAMQYFTQSSSKGFEKSNKFLIAYDEIKKIKGFIKINEEVQLLFITQIMKDLNNKWDQIIIKPNKTEMLYFTNSLNSNNFIHILKKFKNISIQMMYFISLSRSIKSFISNFPKNENSKITLTVIFPARTPKISKEFKKCKELVHVSMSPSVREIHKKAFKDCESLKQVSISSSVSKISFGLFQECHSLEKVAIPSSVTEIESHAFFGCLSLKQVNIPSSVKSIGLLAFGRCESITRIVIPSSVTCIESEAFESCYSLRQIEIPSSVTEIEESAFNNCHSLIEIKIPPSVTKIQKKTFCCCSSLMSIFIPTTGTKIGEAAFKKCNSLRQIEIPSSVTDIGPFCFEECTSLDNVSIPSNVTKIGENAFHECLSLTQITLPSPINTKLIGITSKTKVVKH